MKKVILLIVFAAIIFALLFVDYGKNEYEVAHKDMIVVTSPLPESTISSPVTVTGKARGPWYFEADFPIIIVNWDGLIIGEGYATAQGDWMTEEYVPFEGTVEFTKPSYKNNGAIIFKKDNPSGLPENEDALEIPIYFEM